MQSREPLEYVLGHSSFDVHTFHLLLAEVKCIVGYLAVLKSTQVMSDTFYLWDWVVCSIRKSRDTPEKPGAYLGGCGLRTGVALR